MPHTVEHALALEDERSVEVGHCDAFAFGQLFSSEPRSPEVEAVRAFNDHMAQATGLQGVIVPLGDGLWVAAGRLAIFF